MRRHLTADEQELLPTGCFSFLLLYPEIQASAPPQSPFTFHLSPSPMPRAKPAAIMPLSKADYEALARFRYHLRQFLSFSEKAAVTAGLTPRQHQALLAIKGFPDRDHVTIGELAEQLQIAHHTAVELTDRLVGQNLVARHPGSHDRRTVFLDVTRKGENLLTKLSLAHRAEIQRIGPRLSALLDDLANS
jgi:DNA-binding MarR family transcriptional regulator